jgi:transposase InsO family protein
MKKSRDTEEQIIGILKQHEAGVKTADLCREHGISAATFYGWKSKYGGMDVSEAQRLLQPAGGCLHGAPAQGQGSHPATRQGPTSSACRHAYTGSETPLCRWA